MYGIVLHDDVPLDATEFARELRKRSVDTRPLFVGMHEQPILQQKGYFGGEAFPVTERLARRGLYLPSGLTLTETQINSVSPIAFAEYGFLFYLVAQLRAQPECW